MSRVDKQIRGQDAARRAGARRVGFSALAGFFPVHTHANDQHDLGIYFYTYLIPLFELVKPSKISHMLVHPN